jgi:hypothetical protein
MPMSRSPAWRYSSASRRPDEQISAVTAEAGDHGAQGDGVGGVGELGDGDSVVGAEHPVEAFE